MFSIRKSSIAVAALASMLTLSSCATTYDEMNYTEEGAVYGTLAGAAAGAGAGLLIGTTIANSLGAPIGAVVGGFTGAMIGYHYDQPQIQTYQVPFRTANAVIEPQYYPKLDELVKKLRRWPDTTVVINGYADSRGRSEPNMYLSELRAQSVAAYLERHGVDADRISIAPYGETSPVASNATIQGRALNREAHVVPSDN